MMQTQEATLAQVPEDFDMLKEQIAHRYDSMSHRLQQVADYAMAHPMFVAVETMATISREADVPLSTLSRFANAMGFTGFSQMQGLFRDQYLNHPRDYKERVRKAWSCDRQNLDSPAAVFERFGNANTDAIEGLQQSVSPTKLDRAIELMEQAETIYVQGVRRAYPVAFYLNYALMKSHKRVILLDDHGGMTLPMAQHMSDKDLLLTVTFSPYADETTALIELALDNSVPVVAISDDQMSAHGRRINVCFEVHEGELMGFRSLSSSMYLAQSLAVSLICREIQE